MQRIRHQADAEIIAHATSLLHPQLAHRLEHTHFFTGTDPIFAGLHTDTKIVDGRSYREIAQTLWPFHLHRPAADRWTTVVIPQWQGSRWWWPATVVHELGHVLDWQLGFTHHAEPVTDYATRNRYEAFAVAFAAWVLPFGYGHGDAKDRLYEADRRTVALFEELAT